MFLTTGINAFDTLVLNTFLNNLPPHFIGSAVVLNNEELGEFLPLKKYGIEYAGTACFFKQRHTLTAIGIRKDFTDFNLF